MSLSRELIVAAKARADAATDGPWEIEKEHHRCYLTDAADCEHPDSRIMERMIFRETEGDVEYAEEHVHESFDAHRISPDVAGNYDWEEGGIVRTVDAVFIAAARADVPVMADALLRVLDIHTEKHGEAPVYAPDDVMHDGPIVGWEPYTMCAGCHVSPYPCATVRAVTGDGSSSNTERSEQ